MSATPKSLARKQVPLWGTLLAAAGIALTVALGFWQLGRAEYKRELQARIAGREDKVADLLLHRVEATGRYDPTKQVLLDNRVYQGRAGFHVVMPLRISGSNRYLLVNRGWIAAGAERTRAPRVVTPAGEVEVRGRAVEGATRYIELSTQVAEGNIWQNLVIERYRLATGLDVLPLIVQQEAAATNASDDGLTRDWPPADLRRNTNLAYAVQWFALALAIFLYIVVLHVRSRNRPAA